MAYRYRLSGRLGFGADFSRKDGRRRIYRLGILTEVFAFWMLTGHALAQITWGAVGDAWVNAPEYENFHVVVPTDASGSTLDAAADFCRLWKTSTRHEIDFDNTASGRINVWIGTDHLPGDLASQLDGTLPGEDQCYLKTYTPPARYAARGAAKQLMLAGEGELLRLGVRTFFREILGVTWAAPGVTAHPRAGYTIPSISLRIHPAFRIREVDPRLYTLPGVDADQVREFRLGVGLSAKPMPVPPDPLSVPIKSDAGDSPRPVWGSPEAAAALADRITALVQDPEGSARYQWPPGEGDWSLGLLQPDFTLPAGHNDGSPPFADLLIKTACETARLLEQRLATEPWRIRIELPEGITATAVPAETACARRLVVQLTPTHLDFFRDLNDRSAQANRRFRADLKAWRTAGIRVHVMLPLSGRAHPESLFPVFRTLGGMMMALHEESVEGVYLGYPWLEESGGSPSLGPWRAFLAALLAFDCGLDPQVLSRRFCVAYYGETAADAVLEAIQMAEQDFRPTGRPLDLDDDGSWLAPDTRQQIRLRLEPIRDRAAEALAVRLNQLLELFQAGSPAGE